MFKKVGKLDTYENTSKDIVKAFFKRKAPEANANFNVFESQFPKIKILSEALKPKLSKYHPQWSYQSVDASRQFDHPSWQCSVRT